MAAVYDCEAPKATMEKGATREGAITAAHRSHNGRLIA